MNIRIREFVYGFLQEAASAITAGVMDALVTAQNTVLTQSGREPGTGYELVTGETAAKIAAQLGVDPSTIQVVKAPPGYTAAQAKADPSEKMVRVRTGEYVAFKDIPKGPDGQPTTEWVDENCGCDEHNAKRAAEKGLPKKAMDNGYI